MINLNEEDIKTYDKLVDTVEIAVPKIKVSLLKLETALHMACFREANLDKDKASELYTKYLELAEEVYLENKDYFDEQLK